MLVLPPQIKYSTHCTMASFENQYTQHVSHRYAHLCSFSRQISRHHYKLHCFVCRCLVSGACSSFHCQCWNHLQERTANNTGPLTVCSPQSSPLSAVQSNKWHDCEQLYLSQAAKICPGSALAFASPLTLSRKAAKASRYLAES